MTDALERIKNRQRPEVPKRDPGLTPTVPEIIDNSMSGELDTSIPIYPDIQISTLPGTEVSPPTIEVKQTTLRLEKAEVSGRLLILSPITVTNLLIAAPLT